MAVPVFAQLSHVAQNFFLFLRHRPNEVSASSRLLKIVLADVANFAKEIRFRSAFNSYHRVLPKRQTILKCRSTSWTSRQQTLNCLKRAFAARRLKFCSQIKNCVSRCSLADADGADEVYCVVRIHQ